MRHNGRAPLLASTMRPENLDLRDGEPRMAVCPDCQTWHRLTRSMITPHRSSDGVIASNDRPRRYFGDKPAGGRRCPGSAQRITIDITVEQWGEKLLAADSTATGRRSARQHYKPIAAPAKPVAKMTPAPVSAADALTAYREHLKKCRARNTADRCGGTRRCADGTRLAALYEQLQRTQPRRDRERKEETRVDALLTRYRVAMAGKRTAAEWAKHREATADAKKATAKRSGTTVEEANNACRIHPAESVSEFRGPGLPLLTA
ncbi:hypothetical protein OHA79_52140 (plasmid) [Streptomyces sp. NBC_00841]|uniref:hypothetical protein n=1 Tax=Streptomyces sp. NBC_00841 TaxID=2975847 RepID=UPI002DD81607|nr:hypothetical protein [Streptomyces sp. NBC_00841]WSA06033.1 hypothetical protein OHA79_52140 [Streptomyces sp. NBC_00841]